MAESGDLTAPGEPKKLRAVSAEFVRGMLIRLSKSRAESIQRNFVEVARNDYVVTYEHVDRMTRDQAEFIVNEIVTLISSFNYEERKIRSGLRGVGRPSLDFEPDEEDVRSIRDISAKRKIAERTIEDICSVFDLENPLS